MNVLIDGRSIYDPLLGGVNWYNIPVAIDDIERLWAMLQQEANRRYLYFAQKADIEGFNDVSAVFRPTGIAAADAGGNGDRQKVGLDHFQRGSD